MRAPTMLDYIEKFYNAVPPELDHRLPQPR
jgi:hypothetical protein